MLLKPLTIQLFQVWAGRLGYRWLQNTMELQVLQFAPTPKRGVVDTMDIQRSDNAAREASVNGDNASGQRGAPNSRRGDGRGVSTERKEE